MHEAKETYLIKKAWMLQSLAYASAGCGISMGAGIFTAFVCANNQDMMSVAEALCGKYKASTYITLTINTAVVWISSVSVRKGK